jgi:thiamine biosynthesis protein ThiS
LETKIEIRLNGEGHAVRSGINVQELIIDLGLLPGMIIVEHNGEILKRNRYASVPVAAGDSLELVHFVGGG